MVSLFLSVTRTSPNPHRLISNLHPIAFISRFCTGSTSWAPPSCPPRFQYRSICGYSVYNPLVQRGPRKLGPPSTPGAKGELLLHRYSGRGGGRRMFHDYFTTHLPRAVVKPERSSKSRLVSVRIFSSIHNSSIRDFYGFRQRFGQPQPPKYVS